jgi:4-carboxymuconolactone decarboxylase
LKHAALVLTALGLADPVYAQEPRTRAAPPAMQAVTPGLATYTDEVLFGDVWVRPQLAPRDRSLVVVSVLIATGKTAQLEGHLGRALYNGVQPTEAAAIVTQAAFYAGWPSAVSSLEVFERVFAARKIDMAALSNPPPQPPAPRQARPVSGQVAALAPKFAELNDQVVFGDLWRRTDLSPRDRSLVTIAMLAATGEADQLEPYLRRGVEAGLTPAQIGEALTHLAFYAGWPKAEAALKAAASTLGSSRAAAATPAAAPSSNFTGRVSVGERFRGTGGSRLGGAPVTFEAGARTKWHIHPIGQLLVVMEGRGWMQIEGEPARALWSGDVVWTPPGAKHWHGATRASGMTHVAVAETVEGHDVRWLEPVSDAQYRGPE